MTKSLASLDDERTLVTLELRSDADERVQARLTDSIPSTHALSVDEDSDTLDPSGGAVAIDCSLDPGTVQRLGYLLTGPSAPAASAPRIESVTATTADVTTGVGWTAPDGDRVELGLATETTAGEDTDSVSMLSAPDDGSAADSSLSGAAVGVILTPTNEDAVLRTVLRASRRGHTVFATSSGVDEDAEILDMLETLGVLVLTPPSKFASQLELHRLLSQSARAQGMPGILLQTRDCPRIDYERTAAVFAAADYEVIAIPELWNQSPENPEVVVGIPAYNAADSIADVVERALPYASEVLVVDDGSRDGTAERAKAAGATVVSHERNKGYGGALKTIFREAAALDVGHLVVIDADGQHDPADIPILVETQQRDDADIVIGSRYVGTRETDIPLVRSLGLAVINNLTNASMGNLRPSGFIRDTQSGYRAYGRHAVNSLARDSSIGNNMGASTDILYHAHRNRLSVAEVGTTISYEVANASSQGSFSHGMDLLRNIFWTVEYGRPLLILGAPGALVTLLGVFTSVLLVGQYTETGVLAAVPLATSLLFALGGMLLCIMAVMMHVLNGHPTLKRLGNEDNS